MTFDRVKIRQDFPILQRKVHGKPLVYFDTAATAQKPQCVIDTIQNYYQQHNANIHRSVHTLADETTQLYEQSRETIADFINAQKDEVVFVRGTTEGLNLLANTFGRAFLQSGDEVIISEMEHHANIVPWQILRDEKGIELKVIPMTDSGELDLSVYPTLFSEKTKLVSVIHASNALGTINPVEEIIDIAHQHDVPVMLDATQSVVHGGVDVKKLDCDFLVFSGHKLYGPTGIGILYGKKAWLEKLPPYQGGGEMIAHVTLDKTTYAEVPHKFEAGTPNIVGPIGLAAAINYLNQIDFAAASQHEQQLLCYATEQLQQVKGLRILGPELRGNTSSSSLCRWGSSLNKVPVISFVIDGVHSLDLATMIDLEGVAIRTGHHCAMPTMQRLGVQNTARASFGIYNTQAEVDHFVNALIKAQQLLVA